MTNYFELAIRDARHAFSKALPPSRACEQCPKTAWLLSTETRDGYLVREFLCPNGHQKITQERSAWGGGDVPQQQET